MLTHTQILALIFLTHSWQCRGAYHMKYKQIIFLSTFTSAYANNNRAVWNIITQSFIAFSAQQSLSPAAAAAVSVRVFKHLTPSNGRMALRCAALCCAVSFVILFWRSIA